MKLEDVIADLEDYLEEIEDNYYYLTVEKLHEYLSELLDKLHKVNSNNE